MTHHNVNANNKYTAAVNSCKHASVVLTSVSRSANDSDDDQQQRGPEPNRSSLADLWPVCSPPVNAARAESFDLFAASFEDFPDVTNNLYDVSPIKLANINHANTNSSEHDGYPVRSVTFLGSATDDGTTAASSRAPTTTTRAMMPAVIDSSTPWWIPAPAPRNPIFILKTARAAFESCRYLLPCLQGVDNSAVNISSYGRIHHYRNQNESTIIKSTDTVIATRRVEAAVCAFGGSIDSKSSTPGLNNHSTSSIFRLKGMSGARRVYENRLYNRFSLKESRLSWGVEENPPVYISPNSDEIKATTKDCQSTPKNSNTEKADFTAATNSGDQSMSSSIELGAKMKYRCKMCGQMKQNHHCPYRQSLRRSIGVMVYPTVNSFTADEPGVIAPALTMMNNFVSYDSDQGSSCLSRSAATTTAAAAGEHIYNTQQSLQQQPRHYSDHNNYYHPNDTAANESPHSAGYKTYKKVSTVTPEAFRQNCFSPKSSESYHSDDAPLRALTTNRHQQQQQQQQQLQHQHQHQFSPTFATSKSNNFGNSNSAQSAESLKRMHGDYAGESLTTTTTATKRSRSSSQFVTSVTLRPEHYRAVTALKDTGENNNSVKNTSSSSGQYSYPSVPVTFGERKRLSDTLFSLSKAVPTLTADCALVLQAARERNDWDLAVAELLTQVVVALYCCEDDARLDGLQKYLLAIGVSC